MPLGDQNMALSGVLALAILLPAAVGRAQDDLGQAGTPSWYAYQPPRRPALPALSNANRQWINNDIDRFIIARLESNGLTPNERADKVTLVRRAYFDLIGLPPTPQQVEAFLNDGSDDAWEKLIDQLLASPHYGEKWGRHWLDLVRWAETNGYERDGDKPNAWRYRDYVINSFNSDKPYNQFILEQLAGDELENVTPESITATGYYRLGLWDDEPADPLLAKYDQMDDLVSTTGQVMLGMAIGCARCHDHKVDPISQDDYYSFLAFFHNVTSFSSTRGVSSPNSQTMIATPEQIKANEQARTDKIAELNEQIAALEQIVYESFSNPEKEDALAPQVRAVMIEQRYKDVLSVEQVRHYEDLKRRVAKVPVPPVPYALSVTEAGANRPDTFILQRGNPHIRGAKVEPGFPSVLTDEEPHIPSPAKDARSSGSRLALAKWIAGKDNPSTARTMVNRIWQHHFGRGIVETTNDFGGLGTPPTHPQLLDWLAVSFMENEWSIKRMHKLIMTSATYRMSSRGNEVALEKDPANSLFWRFNMRRLTAEEIRDAMLAVNGELNLSKVGGPSVYPPLPQAVLATSSMPNKAWGRSSREDANRRSVYIFTKRSLRHPMIESFDGPDTDSTCAVRFVTTVPTQSLTMLNSEFMQEQADLFARRLDRLAPGEIHEQVRHAIELTTCNKPSEADILADLAFIETLVNEENLKQDQAMRLYCLMMLNQNAFVFLD